MQLRATVRGSAQFQFARTAECIAFFFVYPLLVILPSAAQTVTVSPSSFSFGNQVLSTSSATRTATLTNTSTTQLIVSSIIASGDFSQTNTCGSSIRAGKKCTIKIAFTPTILGTRTGDITISDNASDSPQTIALTGTGIEPVSLSRTSLTFGNLVVEITSAAKSVTLTNHQSVSLNISNIVANGDFAQTNTCGTTVLPKAHCTISVTFMPTNSGTRTGGITVTDDASDSPGTIALSGTGIAVTLTKLTVTPAPVTLGVSQTQQFAATGTYNNKTTQDLTSVVAWTVTQGTKGGTTTSLGLYTAPTSVGSFTVKATNSSPLKSSTSKVTVVAQQAPLANPGGPYTGSVNQSITFDGSKSSDPDGDQLTYAWTFGDGSAGSGVAPTHTYNSAATFTVSLTVTDTSGRTATASTTATISNSNATPVIQDFSPKSGPVGTLLTITGTNFASSGGGSPQVTMNSQGGGTVSAPVDSFTSTNITLTIPTGAASGPLSVTANGQSATSSALLTVTTASSFTLSATPSTANLIQGQSTSFAVTLNSSDGFNQLAALSVSGTPTGASTSLSPTQISAGQTSILTVSAAPDQAAGGSSLVVTASATVGGVPVTQSATVTLQVASATTSFLGRTVVDDAKQTPIAGVTITFLGKNPAGDSTGCTGETRSDAAGNFSLTSLPDACLGLQLISYDGSTATAPDGKYAGVDLSYALQANQVTVSPVLIHLPRIDDKEFVEVQQNAPNDQTFTFKTIPHLSITVYAGTTLSLADGSHPDPFQLYAVEVPVDRLPDSIPASTLLTPFIVAFQPANAVSSQPIAVNYPNTLNHPPGTNVTLMTLDPTLGYMVGYGTGTVSNDGTQIVADSDPHFAGHGYGLVHFDWHGATPLPANDVNPCKDAGDCPCCGDPVDLSSGLLVIRDIDISIDGNRGGIAFERTYRNLFNPTGSMVDAAFGYGTSHNYAYRLDQSAPQNANVINLVMPDGNHLPFSKQADGTWTNGTVPRLQGAVLKLVSPGITDLRWKDGTTFRFSGKTGGPFNLSSLDSITDPNGNITTLVNTNAGRVTDIIDPVGRRLHIDFDGSGRITQLQDSVSGRTVSYSYTGIQPGVLRVVQYPDGTTVRYDYDLNNNLTLITDRRGTPTASSTYDVNGRVIKQVRGDGSVFQFSYKLLNPLVPTSPVLETTVTDPLGRNTVYRFNPQGFLIDVIDPLGQLRDIARDGANQVVKYQGTGQCDTCSPVQNGDRSYSYDGSGNITSVTDALGNTTTYSYDPIFNKVNLIKDALGNKTTFTYDGHGNLLSRTDANGKTTSYGYNGNGLPTRATDPLGQKTQFGYDSFGNLISVTDALGNTTQFRYDGLSRLLELQDSLGRKTATEYDSNGRVTKVTDPLNQVTTFTYDGNGNILALTDARNKVTAFTYDPLNRIQSRKDPVGKSDTRNYDPDGNLISFTDRRGQASSFAYDTLDRLITETYPDSTVTRSYDATSRLIGAVDSAGGTFTFDHDPVGRLLGSNGPFGSIAYVRDALGRVSRRQVVGQSAVDYSYDPVGNFLSATMPQASVGYTYDARNAPLHVTRANGVTSDYTYDPVGRVLSIAHALGVSTIASLGYSYDNVGNRVSQQTSSAQALTTQAATATYDDANRLIQRAGTSYSYDENGNLASENGPNGLTTYAWDSRNRLKSITAGSGQTTFTYDFAGNLIGQNDSGISHTFVLDQIMDVAYEQSSDGDQFSVLSGQWLDSHFATVRNGSLVEYGLSDATNSTVATVDQTGALKGKLSYEPFGQTAVASTNYAFQFTGRIPVTANFYYYRARFYSPTIDRFTSEDPLQLSTNPYNYVSNDPLSNVDPTGLRTEQEEGRAALDAFLLMDRRGAENGVFVVEATILLAGLQHEGGAAIAYSALNLGFDVLQRKTNVCRLGPKQPDRQTLFVDALGVIPGGRLADVLAIRDFIRTHDELEKLLREFRSGERER